MSFTAIERFNHEKRRTPEQLVAAAQLVLVGQRTDIDERVAAALVIACDGDSEKKPQPSYGQVARIAGCSPEEAWDALQRMADRGRSIMRPDERLVVLDGMRRWLVVGRFDGGKAADFGGADLVG